jgi:hypothetical protein
MNVLFRILRISLTYITYTAKIVAQVGRAVEVDRMSVRFVGLIRVQARAQQVR